MVNSLDIIKGLVPPQHFNCRSTTVPVVIDKLQDDILVLKSHQPLHLIQDQVQQVGFRKIQTYATWLKDNPDLQIKTLGSEQKDILKH